MIKRKSAIFASLFLIFLAFSACATEPENEFMAKIPGVTNDGQVSEVSGGMDSTAVYVSPEEVADRQAADIAADVAAVGIPEFFKYIGKPLSLLKNEHPEAEIFDGDGFPDAYAACFGEREGEYAYCFFGGQDGDFEKAMEECGEQLKCAGFCAPAGVLFPEMKDDMSFADFFSLIGVSSYEYFIEENVAQGWLRFTYNN